MQPRSDYRALGWRNDHWDLVRLYRSLRIRNSAEWFAKLTRDNAITITQSETLQIQPAAAALLSRYITDVQADSTAAFDALRTEEAALAECKRLGVTVGSTPTKNQEHHQSSKALVAEVTAIAQQHCKACQITFEASPQRRAIWFGAHGLHVSARNLDGAIPGLFNPIIVWEIKEYWGKTSGGSKMSDAVYECQLVGRELRGFDDRTGQHIVHAVFLDGKDQWASRRSDLVRFIDLFQQGLIDHLFIGKQVKAEWPAVLRQLLKVPA